MSTVSFSASWLQSESIDIPDWDQPICIGWSVPADASRDWWLKAKRKQMLEGRVLDNPLNLSVAFWSTTHLLAKTFIPLSRFCLCCCPPTDTNLFERHWGCLRNDYWSAVVMRRFYFCLKLCAERLSIPDHTVDHCDSLFCGAVNVCFFFFFCSLCCSEILKLWQVAASAAGTFFMFERYSILAVENKKE